MIKQSFNEGWTFCKQDGSPEEVTLPHDAQLSETRSPWTSDSGHGYFPGGIYTYTKTFTAPEEWEGKKLLLEFEGVYRNSTVSLNGAVIGGHRYGYTTFAVPLDALLIGHENTITVTADNSQLPNSRWYTGAGIYRPVWLYVGGEKCIRRNGLRVRTKSYSPARILVETAADTGELTVEIYDGDRLVASGAGNSCEISIPDAKLWSAEQPKLYTCRAVLSADGQIADTAETDFGIRKLEWSNQGFLVNGENTLLRGGCIHHDSGILGAATYDESELRRVRILKKAGFNAIRSAHNPTSRAFLDACDRLGMYVIDETFDMWYNRKNRYDYGCDFPTCWEEDTRAMVERDYNHPSVVMYSVGNEVAEPHDANGVLTGKAMITLIHSIDSSRPVTCGLNLMIMKRAAAGKGIYQDGETNTAANTKKNAQSQNASLSFNIMASFIGTGMNKGGNSGRADAIAAPFINALDIAGYNYGSGRYPLEQKKHPERIVYGSETFPQDIYKNWKQVKKYPYLIGDFMWTAWDYLGEAGIGAWSYTGGMPFNRPYPWVLSGAGVIDILGRTDGSCRYASTVWGLETKPVIAVKPVNHPGVRPSKSVWRGTNAVESWSWSGCDGNRAEIEVYSDAYRVELQLNGRKIGRKRLRKCRAIFRTPYEAGTLTAIAYDRDNTELSRSELLSAAEDIRICARPEKANAAPGEVIYVPVTLEDNNGVIESNADRKLSVSVSNGELLGFGSANPCTEEQYHTGSFTSYMGCALAVIRAGRDGVLTVSVSDEAQTAKAEITVV